MHVKLICLWNWHVRETDLSDSINIELEDKYWYIDDLTFFPNSSQIMEDPGRSSQWNESESGASSAVLVEDLFQWARYAFNTVPGDTGIIYRSNHGVAASY